MHSLVKALWRRWTRVAHAIGTFQARLLLTALYVLLLPAFALTARFSADPLRLRPATPPAWLPRYRQARTLDGGRRQF